MYQDCSTPHPFHSITHSTFCGPTVFSPSCWHRR